MRIKISALCVAFIFATAALAQPGSLDLSFNPTTPALGDITGNLSGVFAMAIQPDSKILVGGAFYNNNVYTSAIFRLNADGSLDETFNLGGKGALPWVNSLAIQDDGKIIIGGTIQSYNGSGPSAGVIRINADGSLDASFNTSSISINAAIQDIKIQSDGKIILCSVFGGIIRLNSNGSKDPTFSQGTGFGGGSASDSPAFTAILQGDGKIIVGGNFATYNGTTKKNMIRVNNDGSLDESFNTGTGSNGDVSSAIFQSDGKIIIGGGFTSYNGIARNGIARLNADGSLDETFNPGTGVNEYVKTAILQTNGKIIITGFFTSFNGIPRNRIARLNADGSLDETFNPGAGSNGFIRSTNIQADGMIIIGGNFTSYDGVARNRIARINGDEIIGGPLPVTLLNFTANKIKNAVLLQWQTADEQNTSRFIIEKSTDGNSFEAIGNVAAKNTTGNHSYQFTDATAWVGSAQYYRLKMMDTDGRFTYSNIVRVANNSTGAIAVYPNPASDIVVIQQSNDSKLLTKARLLDISGKTIQSISVTSFQQQISLKHLSAGVYMIQFEDGSNVKVVKR